MTAQTINPINPESINRHGSYIKIAPGLTATEGHDGGLPSLKFRREGKVVATFRGSSLRFSDPLTDEDCRYLAALAVE